MNIVITIPLSWDLQLLYGILPHGAGDIKDCFGKINDLVNNFLSFHSS